MRKKISVGKGLKNLLNRTVWTEYEKQHILNHFTNRHIRRVVFQKDESNKDVEGEFRLQRYEKKGKPVGSLLLILVLVYENLD